MILTCEGEIMNTTQNYENGFLAKLSFEPCDKERTEKVVIEYLIEKGLIKDEKANHLEKFRERGLNSVLGD